MKKIFLALLICISGINSFAHHTKGGWMRYEYLGPGISDPANLRYKITLKLYVVCNASAQQIDDPINFSFFDGNNQFIKNVSVSISDQVNIQNCTAPQCNPCLSPIPSICYKIVTYETITELAPSLNGYTISYQRCCRIDILANVQSTGDNVGDTWTIKIPGTVQGNNFPQNSSPLFLTNDTTIICAQHFFSFKFDATDSDGDSLSYSFDKAFDVSSPMPPNPPTAATPPYNSVPYIAPFSALQPLGSGVTINPISGLVSGIAPNVGEYVVTVVVTEYRNGIAFATARKSLHIIVSTCNPLVATLNTQYTFCDTYTASFQNNASNPAGTTYQWNFGDANSGAQNTSTLSNPVHIYSDTGIFKLKLTVTLNGQCSSSDSSIVKVYPGFFPGFTTAGQCKNTQIQFTDISTTKYGVVNAWSWNFGDATTLADTSHTQNPRYSFGSAGNYDVTFFVSNSKGCADTLIKTITITDKPSLSITNDTLICAIDTLQLNAFGNGSVFWTPNYNINNQNNPAPLVSPKVPTKYYVTLTDPFGCKASDSVFVNVVQSVTLDGGADTSICQGDIIQLNPSGNALNYVWTPSSPLNNNTLKNPLARPLVTTTFYVIGSIGKCQAKDSVKIKVTPYPAAVAKLDTAICFGDIIQLHASGGSSYSWSPPFFLNNPNIPDPVANPNKTIRYIATVTDTLGCPKPVYDTVTVQVQRVFADAGPRDTIVVINQPLQLNATGGKFYLWSPATGLSATDIANPVAKINGDIDYMVRVSNETGCFDTDTISVKLYSVTAGLYVPNAFTPNGDGLNDVFIPIALGMKQINYFRIYNRWGQLMYSTSEINKGWDGTFKGKPQQAGVFVWIVDGVDYKDSKVSQKGIVTLIR